MTKYCYIHKDKEAFKECERCGHPICYDCSNSYWHTNAISSMFLPQRSKEQEMIFCSKCLKKAKLRNAFISGFLLIMILGLIAATIIFSIG